MERVIGLVAQAARDAAQPLVLAKAWFPGDPTVIRRLPPGLERPH